MHRKIVGTVRGLENAMAYIRLPLGIKVALEYNWNGKAVVNIYHVTTADPITSIKLDAIADIFISWFTVNLALRLSDEIELTGVTAMNLDVPNGEKVEVAVTPPEAGQVASESVSNNVASVVTLGTLKTGRSFRGRTYVPGIAEVYVSSNDLDATLLAAIISDYVILDGLLFAADTELVVASFQTAGAPRAEGVATEVSSITANARVDTQRRRLPKA